MKKLVPSGRTIVATTMAAAAAATFAVGPSAVHAADHRDGPQVQLEENIAADINDVYAFMAGDRAVVAMTVFPAADANAAFSDAAVYAINISRHPAFGEPAGGTTDVLCTFDASGTIECWIGDEEYLTGEADSDAGLESESGRVKVFAGLRTDPFYFNLMGFNTTRLVVQGAFAGISLNPNGCPILDAGTAAALRNGLVATEQSQDFFGSLNTLAIVLELDPDLVVDSENPIFSVYGSTHVKQGEE